MHQLIHERTQHMLRARGMHCFDSHSLAAGQPVVHAEIERPRSWQLEQLPHSAAGRFEAQP